LNASYHRYISSLRQAFANFRGLDGEANLDIQYAVSLSYKVPVNYYSTGGRGILVPDLDQADINMDSNEPYLDFLHYILQQDVLPQTITTSYGEDEQSVPASYAQEVCSMFGQLGARGVSVVSCF
jgi:tripeptidyl-peptidase I